MRNTRRIVAATATVLLTAGLAQAVPGSASLGATADPTANPTAEGSAADAFGGVDRSLGNGLGRLLTQGAQREGRGLPGVSDELEVDQASLAIRDDEGRVLVQLTPTEGADRQAFRRTAVERGFEVTADDAATGTLEGYAALGDIEALAALADLGTIAQVPRPTTRSGSVQWQGVPFQRVDRVLDRGVDGEGITVGILSDSYDTSETAVDGSPIATRAADDVASGDLPGPGNPEGNTQPVVVLEDFDDGADEGRAMAQIVHDIAPAAKLCFATAFNGEVGFADNIRALADPDGACDADVIVDDIGYFSAPFFGQDVIGDAVDEVTADGVSYFSAAGNDGDQNAWRSRVNLVPRQQVRTEARAARLDFSQVPRSLYAGGVQDMRPGSGRDIGQTLQLAPDGGLLNLQWNDPVDADGPTLTEPLLEDSGELTRANSEEGVDFTFTAPRSLVGDDVLVSTDAVPSGTTDLVLTITTPSGRVIGPEDTGTSPETLGVDIRKAGDYTITVSGFDGATGDFTVDVRQIEVPSRTTTDFNALLFGPGGKFYGAVGDDNTLSGRPSEVAPISLSSKRPTSLQLVIAKATPRRTPVTEIAYINSGGIYTEEYWNPLAPATYGHPTAAGANGVAAIDPFRSYLSESYTSPGGAMRFYFDARGRRLPQPQVRRKPDIASTDRGNTTFFVADDPRDADDFPNFGGTSAAAPHAAAIAALMLDHAGGPGSLSPTRVKQTLKRTAFKHDLDPFRATGSAGGVTVTAVGAPGDERDASPASMDDPNFFRVSYRGRVPLRSVRFLGRTASPTALGPRRGGPSAGLVFDPRPLAARTEFRTGGYPFRVGNVSPGVRRGAVTHRLFGRVGATRLHRGLQVRFRDGLRGGQTVRFGIDRDLRFPGGGEPPYEGNSADEIGGAIFLPRGAGQERGMKFDAVLANGRRITGFVRNDLGKGFSPVDGFGPANAYAAVFAAQP